MTPKALKGRSATQRDVAAIAGVSVATVSYVISGRRDRRNAATPEIEARVRAAVAALGYSPQRAGRVLRRSKTDVLAVASPTPLSPWAQEVMAEVETVAEGRGLHVVTVNYGGSEQQNDRAAQLLRDGIADAVIVLSAHLFGVERLDTLAAQGLPVLAIGPETLQEAPERRWDALIEGHSAGFEEALRHLLKVNIERIAFVAEGVGEPKAPALRQAMMALGLADDAVEFVEARVNAATAPLDMHSTIRALLGRGESERPEALLVSSDRGAIAAMWTAIDLDLGVPDEISVIGSGNIAEGRAVRPELSTVGFEPQECRPVIEHLLDRINEDSVAPMVVTIPWRLIPRGTIRVPEK